MSEIAPKFMGGKGVLAKINDMRNRGGIGDLPQVDTVGTVPEPTEAGVEAEMAPPTSSVTPLQVGPQPGLPDHCREDLFGSKMVFAGTMVAPLAMTAYQAWKRQRYLSRYDGLPCDTGPTNEFQAKRCLLKRKSDQHAACFGDGLGAPVEDTVEMMGRRHPWSYPAMVAGAAIAGYHGHREDKGWKNTATWASLGLLFPVFVGGFALYKTVSKKGRKK